jgi:hypothetical protein
VTRCRDADPLAFGPARGATIRLPSMLRKVIFAGISGPSQRQFPQSHGRGDATERGKTLQSLGLKHRRLRPQSRGYLDGVRTACQCSVISFSPMTWYVWQRNRTDLFLTCRGTISVTDARKRHANQRRLIDSRLGLPRRPRARRVEPAVEIRADWALMASPTNEPGALCQRRLMADIPYNLCTIAHARFAGKSAQ